MIWWDSINLSKGPVKGWILRGLAEDEGFAELMLDWLEGSYKPGSGTMKGRRSWPTTWLRRTSTFSQRR